MRAILQKEINLFFSSLIAYISMSVFFIVMGLNLFVFEGNIPDSQYATLDSFFTLAPWVLIFLIPAITMRTFADERQSGTLELLSTQPVTDTQIVLGKYLATLLLWLFTFLPTLLYFVAVKQLSLSEAPIDSGATWGSYIGLFFLGAVFAAIGIFASSVTGNQIVAFLAGVFMCYLMYDAFFRISSLPVFSGQLDYLIQAAGLNAHYDSISRGVVDTRDIIYFLSVIALFLIATRTALESRKW
ncbi:MAG TPA: gliding motility-associated ABC transporter permease subunit GldF [Chitinophagales bacterium]|nr:gliding motility-associated ABC transporter permease subunit GldF [Chitinophagales bacterium]